jgi:hypothetical protein
MRSSRVLLGQHISLRSFHYLRYALFPYILTGRKLIFIFP